MNRLYKGSTLILVLFFFLCSCESEVDLNIPNAGERLVVEASINWEKGGEKKQSQTIKLSMSMPFGDRTPIPVTDARKVMITKNNDNQQFIFEHQKDGTYKTDEFVAKLNQSYTLRIEYKNKVIEATETLIPVPEIALEKTDDGKQLSVSFKDPADASNFYLLDHHYNNSPNINLIYFTTLIDDEDMNGDQISFNVYNIEYLKSGESINFFLYGISEAYYRYMDLLKNQQESTDEFTQTPPVQLKGNCVNINDPDEKIFGFFNLSEVSKKTYMIK